MWRRTPTFTLNKYLTLGVKGWVIQHPKFDHLGSQMGDESLLVNPLFTPTKGIKVTKIKLIIRERERVALVDGHGLRK
jgi:hypothetical protein